MRQAEAVAHLVTDEAELAHCRILVDDDDTVARRTVVDPIVVDDEHLPERCEVDSGSRRSVPPPLHEDAALTREYQLGYLAGCVAHGQPAENARPGQVDVAECDITPVVGLAASSVAGKEVLVVVGRLRLERAIGKPAEKDCPGPVDALHTPDESSRRTVDTSQAGVPTKPRPAH